MPSKKIEDLSPRMQILYQAFKEKMDATGIPFAITCTARQFKEQVALYAQGRQPLDEVNKLRKAAGLTPITSEKQNVKVTWTLKSKHLVDLDDGSTSNDKSDAFDIVILKDKKASWDIKVNVNGNNKADYLEAGEIGKSVGLRWGGDFKSPDYPHFEDPISKK